MRILTNAISVKYLIIAIGLFSIYATGFAQVDADDPAPINQARLEQLLSPIALYPDTILSHILVAATYPLEVVQAERWVARNPDLEASAAVDAVRDKGWDPSIQALVAFPQILKRLSDDLEWTQALGEAFLEDEERLLAGVQSLRQRAADAGNLEDMDKVEVTRDEDTIVIESIEREVVYVPYYDSRTIYGPWHWANYSPIYWDYPYYGRHYAYDRGRNFYWGPRISVSFGFFFNAFNWHNHHIVRIPSRHYRNHRYFNNRQIVGHNHARRWAHNPKHRRGVVYRNAYAYNHFRNHKIADHNDGRSGNNRSDTPDDVLERLRDSRNVRPGTRQPRHQTAINNDEAHRYSRGKGYTQQRQYRNSQPIQVSKPQPVVATNKDSYRRYSTGKGYTPRQPNKNSYPIQVSKPQPATTPRPPSVAGGNDSNRRYSAGSSYRPGSEVRNSRPVQVSKPQRAAPSRPQPQVAASSPKPATPQVTNPSRGNHYERPRSRSKPNESNTRRNRSQTR